jgi:outer membrane protein assembly factor BamA
VRSISSEQGQRLSVSLRVSDRAVGSEFSFWQLSTTVSRYLLMPWSSSGLPLHHALALRASFGISRGDLSRRHLYFLGGFQQGDPIRAVLYPTAVPARTLRGFVTDAFYGEMYALGSAEYRFPLWNVETGAWTLPLYLRRFHAALFTDVGDAWTAGKRNFALHAGAGAELRAEVVLGYILPADLRFGCARGLERSDVAILDCYAALGGVF